MSDRVPSALILDPHQRERIYSDVVLAQIRERCDLRVICAPDELADPRLVEALPGVRVVWSGWGGLKLIAKALERLPALELYLYAAGTVKPYLTDAVWERSVRVCGAWGANAVPVAEWAFAQIVLCLKQAWRLSAAYREARQGIQLTWPGRFGAYATTVGLISLGQIGQRLAKWLQSLEVNVIAYDPFVKAKAMQALGIEKVDALEAVFERSEVVSLHTPWLPETEGMIHAAHFARMGPGASFINTARGAVVHEPDLVAFLQARPDCFACLDVTWPEPPAPESPLWTLPNVFLTPHLAGAQGGECHRMAQFMIEDFDRWQRGEALQHEVTRERLPLLA
ncbi:MAG: hydroxyacid dehydrogenase [Opitutales bacterium]